MLRDRAGFTVAALLLLSAAGARAQDRLPPCHGRSVNVEHASRAVQSDAVGGLLCAQGGPAAVHLEIRRTTIAAALAALSSSYPISYRTSIALSETRDGIYTGSLGQVISRLLENYNYVMKLQNSTLDLVIFGVKGGQPASAPRAAEPGPHAVRPLAGVARVR
jgi:hypothetical protein